MQRGSEMGLALGQEGLECLPVRGQWGRAAQPTAMIVLLILCLAMMVVWSH